MTERPAGAAHDEGHLPDEGGLAGAVLPHQQHHGLVLEVGLLQGGRVELMEAVVLLQRQQLAQVEVPQPAGHRLHHVGAAAALPPAALLPQPAEHPAALPLSLPLLPLPLPPPRLPRTQPPPPTRPAPARGGATALRLHSAARPGGAPLPAAHTLGAGWVWGVTEGQVRLVAFF